MATFFTADTHFGHASIIKHCRRPFGSVEEMDAVIVKRWNEVVSPTDIVWHLGDVSWRRGNPDECLRRLNGRKHLIVGNHDPFPGKNPRFDGCFESINTLKDIKIGDQKITLCHYAMRTWNCAHHGAWQLFGHSHGNLVVTPGALQMDVGVDCHGFAPVPFAKVKSLMDGKKCSYYR